jgi:hypothetical protein
VCGSIGILPAVVEVLEIARSRPDGATKPSHRHIETFWEIASRLHANIPLPQGASDCLPGYFLTYFITVFRTTSAP